MAKDYELIEHTADIGIRIRAADLAGLFTRAAEAMFDLMAHGSSHGREERVKVVLSAPSVEELLVDWLNELLSLSSVKKKFFTGFSFTEISERRLAAEITGVPFSDFAPDLEIKAATYHGLTAMKVNGSWKAEVIFDV